MISPYRRGCYPLPIYKYYNHLEKKHIKARLFNLHKTPTNILRAFSNLQSASLNNHLPAFQAYQ
jgi:hypothetical protein